jgi:alpha-1,3-rhamnosyltransferase
MNKPLVTAIIPAYNHERYVQQSIRSLLEQTYPHIELLVYNDGSRDNTHLKITEMAPECSKRFTRFEYFNQSNRGLAATLNHALSIAQGKYFTAMASDDIALPDKVDRLLTDLESRGSRFAAAFGDAIFIGDDGLPLAVPPERRTSDSQAPTFIEFYTAKRSVSIHAEDFISYPSLLEGNYLPAMSCLVRTQYAREVGGWTVGNPMEDWEMWLKLAKHYSFSFIPEPVALYRIHGRNLHTTFAPLMGFTALSLLRREKQYCKSSGLYGVWKEQYLSRLISGVLRKPDFSFTQKCSMIDFEQLPAIIIRLMRQAWRKVRASSHK